MPDVLGVENSWFATAAADGLLLDITKRLSADKSFNRSQFFPKILDRFTYHDRNYGIPYDAQPIAGFYYNKTLFDQSHVSYPTTTWSWADMMTAAQKLTKRMGSRVVQYGLDPGDGDWRTFVYAYGGASPTTIATRRRLSWIARGLLLALTRTSAFSRRGSRSRRPQSVGLHEHRVEQQRPVRGGQNSNVYRRLLGICLQSTKVFPD
jgi:hypothetical protein